MDHNHKQNLRLASAIHDELARQECEEPASIPDETWQHCQSLRRRIILANRQGWVASSQRLHRDLTESLQRLRSDLNRIVDAQAHVDTLRLNPTLKTIYRDLISLHDEFDEVSWNKPSKTLSVTTDPITLHDIYFGAFTICLDWGSYHGAQGMRYEIIAIDPHPAASNESIAHPHVQDGSLCAGDGCAAIRQALQDGRLLDFFLIVRNILNTYNASSPYVALDAWFGIECVDCGTIVSEDYRWTCEKCDSNVCGECYYRCESCECVFCSTCTSSCRFCDQTCCESCLVRCAKCREMVCLGCLEDDERCSNCHEEEIEEFETSQNEGHAIASAPLQPRGLGQVSVSA